MAYNVPTVPEVLADGEAGVLMASRDVARLTAAIDRLLFDSAERGRFDERMETAYRESGSAQDNVNTIRASGWFRRPGSS